MRFRSVLALTLLLAAGCGTANVGVSPGTGAASNSDRSGNDHRSYPYQIVTTCGMVTDIVTQVAGDKATVVGLMGEGVDPHLYKPTTTDVKRLTRADVIFYSGLLLEGRMADMFAKLARQGNAVYAVTEGLDESSLLEPPEFGGHFDPHVWMDASAWSQCVAFVAKSLGEFDPTNAKYYEDNAAKYRAEVDKVHQYALKSIATIPQPQRVLITAHDAFGYFSKAYGIDVRSVQGISTESEAGVDDINQLVEFIVSRKIQAIFVESSVSEKNIRAIVEGASRRGWKVAIGGQLFSDAMGAAGTYEGTYLGMMDHNITLITASLGGQVPKKGLHGKLSL